MARRLKFRHRIGLLVLLAAMALLTVTAVTLVLGRRSEQQLSGIETRYVPLIEVDRDLKTTFAEIPRALEDAATAAEDSRLKDADKLAAAFLDRLNAGRQPITDNGGDPTALDAEFQGYYGLAHEVSAAIVAGTSAAQLGAKIEVMRRAQQAFTSHLDSATSPDRRRLAAAFATARDSQNASLQLDIIVAVGALALMALLSWQLIRRTVRSLHEVSLGVERLAAGDFGHEIDVGSGDEIGELAREANRTAVRLREYREQGERETWIKTGLAELAQQIAGELDPVTLGKRAMTYLATYLAADAAIIYAEDHDAFRVLDTYGAADRITILHELRAAEPSSTPIVRVTARSPASHIVTVPLTHGGRTMGILELVMAIEPSAQALELMSRIRAAVGIAFQVAEARQRAQALLVETQRQARAAETANKELEAFSYSVSHDLRAPLRGIDGFSQALLEDHADHLAPKAQDYLRRIRAAAQRMAELIDDLLQLSRVSRGDFRREPVDLSALTTVVVGELKRADPERRVQVIVQDRVLAIADPRLMRITLENLIGNAWKFSAKVSEPMIEFGAREQAGELVYFVRDNGAGFDMSYADRLFGAFQRLHTDKEFPGTGIGLATVQRIVLRHGGRIWVDAAVAHGATFQFTLPEPLAGGTA